MSTPDHRRPGYAPTRIMPQSYADVREIAKEAITAGLFRHPEGQERAITEAQCLFAIMTGMDAGMTPAQAIQAVYVKDGKCNINGAGCLALIRGAGCLVHQEVATEANGWKAVCTITRPSGEVIVGEYTKADAVRMGLWRDEPDASSTWWTTQSRMLGWRAVGRAAADGCSDILRGLHILEVTDSEEVRRQHVSPKAQRAAAVSAPLLDVPDDIAQADPDATFLDRMTGGEDEQQYLAGLETSLATVNNKATLDEVWESHINSGTELSRHGQEKAKELYDAAAKRFPD